MVDASDVARREKKAYAKVVIILVPVECRVRLCLPSQRDEKIQTFDWSGKSDASPLKGIQREERDGRICLITTVLSITICEGEIDAGYITATIMRHRSKDRTRCFKQSRNCAQRT
jgi:hypothetical protein